MNKGVAITIGEEGAAFFYMIGQAITQWSFVEDELFRLAAHNFTGKERRAIEAAYASIESFRSKLSFVNKIFRQSEDFDIFANDWERVEQYVVGQSKVRNTLAHSRVIVFPHAPEGRRYAIVTGQSAPGKKKPSRGSPPAGSLCVREIELFGRQFARASIMIASITLRRRCEVDHYRPMLDQQLTHLSLEQIALQIRAMIGEEPAKRARGR